MVSIFSKSRKLRVLTMTRKEIPTSLMLVTILVIFLVRNII